MKDINNGVLVRTALEGDISRIAELESRCFSVPFTEKSLTELFSNTSWHFFVAELDNSVVGYISLYTILDEKEIVNVCVLPEYRKLGIGAALVKKAISLNEDSCRIVMLEVRESNKGAISLYEKFGFKSVGVSKNHYSQPRENAILMNLEL
ncbi:MAG: ribosomal protein S18-alanine N-acetyltransferase [Clostridia bacterium]|nr:ribosomal protein S18-alanine N-acetyltransferase [Clostridia bacterium]